MWNSCIYFIKISKLTNKYQIQTEGKILFGSQIPPLSCIHFIYFNEQTIIAFK